MIDLFYFEDITIWKIIFFFFLFIIIWKLKHKLIKVFVFYIFKRLNISKEKINKINVLKLFINPIKQFIIVAFLYLSIIIFSQQPQLYYTIFNWNIWFILESICKLIFIISIIRIVFNFIDNFVIIIEGDFDNNKNSDKHLITFFKDFIKTIIVITGILVIIKLVFNQNIGNLLTSLSIVGAAAALATRESIENLIASFIILIDKPFSNGDLVTVKGYQGKVVKIGMRSTKIITNDKTFIIVPNKIMVDSIVDNISLSTNRKIENKLFLDKSNAQTKIMEYIKNIDQILNNPIILEKKVYLKDIDKESYNIYYYYFTDYEQEENEYFDFVQKINIEIIEMSNQLDIKFARFF